MPDYEDIYINGFYFACDVDHGCRETSEDPGEPAQLLAVYIQGDSGWDELESWSPEVERAIYLYVFEYEKYMSEFNPPSSTDHRADAQRGSK